MANHKPVPILPPCPRCDHAGVLLSKPPETMRAEWCTCVYGDERRAAQPHYVANVNKLIDELLRARQIAGRS